MKKHICLVALLSALLAWWAEPAVAAAQKKANLVCFVRFADESESDMFTDYPFSHYDQLFNDQTSGTQSVYNYFKHSSYGQLAWTTTFFPAPQAEKIMSYQAKQPRGYYQEKTSINTDGWDDATVMAARERALIKEIVTYLDANLPADVVVDADDDGLLDNLTIIVSSCSEIGSRHMLWPHRSDLVSATNEFTVNGKRVVGYLLVFDEVRAQITAPTTLGTICHEMSHSLGTYDLYHASDKLNPVGVWDLMSDNQDTPQQMTVYTKYRYCHWGSLDDVPTISTPGTYRLNPVGGSSQEQVAYKIKPVGSDEYFMVEYRKKEGYDSSIPESGLIVYRINPKFSGGNVGYNGTTRLDEQYIFRPGGTRTADGTIAKAALSQESGRTAFGGLTTEKPFYSDGTTANFAIANVSACGETITFDLLETAKQLLLSASELTLKGIAQSGGSVTVSSDEAWQITGVPAWLTVAPLSGEAGSTVVSITANADNTTGGVRTAQLTVSSTADATLTKTIAVSQEAKAGNVVLFDDFENTDNPNGWEISYVGESGRGWQWTEGSTTGRTTAMTHSGTHAMTMKDVLFEDVHMDAKLTSKTFANGTTLTFYSHCNGGNSTPKNPPVYIIEVSSDNGTTWHTVFDVLSDYPRDAEGKTVTAASYTKITIDLSPYKSETMKIRFNCYDTNNEGLQYWWQIDDLEISADTLTGISTLRTDAADAPAAIYDMQGRRVQQAATGVYIVRGADGQSRKIVKK
ncbi:MAG: M6 family metalloprotease domain-containing protein [Prevotella sp.]|nr:M6 family metalloprotease domain-containing protein [Prevotella sp.]